VNPAPILSSDVVAQDSIPALQQIELPGLGVVFDAPTDLQLTDFDIVQRT